MISNWQVKNIITDTWLVKCVAPASSNFDARCVITRPFQDKFIITRPLQVKCVITRTEVGEEEEKEVLEVFEEMQTHLAAEQVVSLSFLCRRARNLCGYT